MTYREEQTITRTETTAPPVRRVSRVTYGPGPLAMVDQLIVFLFGIIEVLIGLRMLLLLVAARQGNDIVAFIYSVSDVFVAPFRGILQIDEVAAGASALDVAAIVALIGWIVIEMLVLGLIRIFRPSATA